MKDPENDPLRFEWVLQEEVAKPSTGGDREVVPPLVEGAISGGEDGTVDVKLPAKPGTYRLYVYVRDDHHGAATANVPLLVDAGGAAR